MSRLSTAILLAALGGIGHAQSSEVDMDQAVQLAVKHNPKIQALALEAQASSNALSAARALTNPSLTITPGLTRAGSDEELLITQPLEINGTRSARAGIARANQMATLADANIELREFVFSVKEAYIELAKALERFDLMAGVAENAAQLESLASRQAELGSRPGIDRTHSKIETKRARQQATLAEAELKSARTAFNALVGQEPSAVTRVNLKFVKSDFQNESDLIAFALNNRDELQASRAKQEGFRQESRLANASLLPDLVPHYRMESFTRLPREGGFGIGISFPLFDHGRVKNEARHADAHRKAEELRMKAVQDQIAVEVSQALARLRAAEEVLKSYDEGLIPESKKLMEATLAGYGLGETALGTVLEAQRTHRSVQSEQIDALVSYSLALAQLDRAIGRVPDKFLYPVSGSLNK